MTLVEVVVVASKKVVAQHQLRIMVVRRISVKEPIKLLCMINLINFDNIKIGTPICYLYTWNVLIISDQQFLVIYHPLEYSQNRSYAEL